MWNSILIRPPSITDNNLWNLLQRMLEFDRKGRISASDALAHPFFTSAQARSEISLEQYQLVQVARDAQTSGDQSISKFDTDPYYILSINEVQKILGKIDSQADNVKNQNFNQQPRVQQQLSDSFLQGANMFGSFYQQNLNIMPLPQIQQYLIVVPQQITIEPQTEPPSIPNHQGPQYQIPIVNANYTPNKTYQGQPIGNQQYIPAQNDQQFGQINVQASSNPQIQYSGQEFPMQQQQQPQQQNQFGGQFGKAPSPSAIAPQQYYQQQQQIIPSNLQPVYSQVQVPYNPPKIVSSKPKSGSPTPNVQQQPQNSTLQQLQQKLLYQESLFANMKIQFEFQLDNALNRNGAQINKQKGRSIDAIPFGPDKQTLVQQKQEMDRAATKIDELQQEVLALMTAEEEEINRKKEELENQRKEELIQAQRRVKEKEEAEAKQKKRNEDEKNQKLLEDQKRKKDEERKNKLEQQRIQREKEEQKQKEEEKLRRQDSEMIRQWEQQGAVNKTKMTLTFKQSQKQPLQRTFENDISFQVDDAYQKVIKQSVKPDFQQNQDDQPTQSFSPSSSQTVHVTQDVIPQFPNELKFTENGKNIANQDNNQPKDIKIENDKIKKQFTNQPSQHNHNLNQVDVSKIPLPEDVIKNMHVKPPVSPKKQIVFSPPPKINNQQQIQVASNNNPEILHEPKGQKYQEILLNLKSALNPQDNNQQQLHSSQSDPKLQNSNSSSKPKQNAVPKHNFSSNQQNSMVQSQSISSNNQQNSSQTLQQMRNTHSYKNSNPKNNTTKHSIPSVQSPQANSPSLKTPSNISDSTTTNNNQEIDLYATIGHKSLNQQENATKFPPGYKRTSDVQPIDNPIITNEFINVHTPPISQVKPSDNEYTSKIMPLPPGQLNSNTCFSQQDNTTENNNQSDRAQVQNQGGHGSRTPPHIESVSRQPTESKKTPSPPHNGNIQLKDSNTKPEQQSSIMTSSKLPIPQSFGVSRRDSLKKK